MRMCIYFFTFIVNKYKHYKSELIKTKHIIYNTFDDLDYQTGLKGVHEYGVMAYYQF